jgi:hypothetical protein
MTDPTLPAAEYREVAEDRLTDNRATYPLAPFLDEPALSRYIWFKQRYQRIRELDQDEADGDLPSTFEQTAYCEKLVAAHGAPIAARAVKRGNVALLSWLTGLTQRDADFSAAQLFSKMVHHLRRDGYMAVFVGSTDGGKTNSALVCAGLYLRDDPDAILATNITELDWREESLNARTHHVESKSDVLELAEQYEDVVVVLDEMSTEANAQTSNYDVNDAFYDLVTFKSKYGLRLFVIGHRESGYDIAPAIREHATHFVVQERERHDLDDDVFSAHFYNEVDADRGGAVDHRFSLEPVPSVDASYDPDETATFELS